MNNIKRGIQNQNKRNAPSTLTNQVKKSFTNAGEKLKGVSNTLSSVAKGATEAIRQKSDNIQKKIIILQSNYHHLEDVIENRKKKYGICMLEGD